MAVQGAAPRIMAPAIYSPAKAGSIHAEYSFEKNIQAKNAIVKGLTAQLIITVHTTPRGFLLTCLMLVKSTWSIMG